MYFEEDEGTIAPGKQFIFLILNGQREYDMTEYDHDDKREIWNLF